MRDVIATCTMTAVWHPRPLSAFSAQTGGVVRRHPCVAIGLHQWLRTGAATYCAATECEGNDPMRPGASLPGPVRMLRHSRAGRAGGAGGGADHAGRAGAAGHQGRSDVPAVGVRQAEVAKAPREVACGPLLGVPAPEQARQARTGDDP